MEAMDMRKIKGQQIATSCRIVKTDKGWQVPSQSGHGTYLVYTESLLSKPKCTCPDHESRGVICKHIYAVELTLKKEIDIHGNTTITQTKRITYSQDWKAYDQAKTKERLLFLELLNDLCKGLLSPEYKFGRPTLPLSDMAFAWSAPLKVDT